MWRILQVCIIHIIYLHKIGTSRVCRIPKVARSFLSFHTLYYIQIVKCLLNEKSRVDLCISLFFFGVYLYFCNIFLSLSHENLNVYITFVFFSFMYSLTFLHTYYIPRHTRSRSFAISITDIRTPLHSLPFVFPIWIFFMSSQSISRSQDTLSPQFFVHARLFKVSSLCNCIYNVIPHFSF